MSSAPGKPPPDEWNQPKLRVPTWLVIVAGVPLLVAMLVEFIAVIARNTGFSFTGSIELVQAMVLLSSSGAMAAATLSRSNAKVTLLSRRLTGTSGRVLRIVVSLGGALLYFALAAGSIWIAFEMLGAHEQSELLGIPYVPLRFVVIVSMTAIALIYARRIFTEQEKS